MNKLLASLLSVGLFLGATTPALAQVSDPVATVAPTPVWKHAYASPGHPVTLEGQGIARAHGRGRLYYHLNDGNVRITGRGVVAIRGTNDVKAFGFGGKVTVGEWTYYWGIGTIKASGTNYDMVLWGKSSFTQVQGSGKATYRGFWWIKYRGINVSEVHLEAVPLPEDLKIHAGSEATLE